VRHAAGAATAGVGIVGVVIGAAFGVLAISKKNQSSPHCTGNACDPTGAQLRSDGLGAASVSTGMFIAGGLLVATGVTLLAIPSHRAAPTVSVRIGPYAVEFSAAW
jgi:hypothetical protein